MALGLWYPNSRAEGERWFDEASERNDALAFVIETGDGERAGVVEVDPSTGRPAGRHGRGVVLTPPRPPRGGPRPRGAVAGRRLRVRRPPRARTANAYAHNDRSRRLLAAVGFVEGVVGREDAFVGGAYGDTRYHGPLEPEWRERAAERSDGADDAEGR